MIGRERGREEGVELGHREGLLELLSARGLTLAAEQQARLETEHDGGKSLAWLRRAAVATSAEAGFEE